MALISHTSIFLLQIKARYLFNKLSFSGFFLDSENNKKVEKKSNKSILSPVLPSALRLSPRED